MLRCSWDSRPKSDRDEFLGITGPWNRPKPLFTDVYRGAGVVQQKGMKAG